MVLVRLHGDGFGSEPRLHRAAQGGRQVHVDHPFRAPQCLCRLRSQTLSEAPRLGQQIIRCGGTGGEPELDGRGSADTTPCVQVLPRSQDRGQQRPERGAAIAGHETDADVGIGETGRLRNQHNVGEDREAAAQAHRRAVDRRDDRKREPEHLLDDLSALAQALVPGDRIIQERADPVQVAARGEGLSGAGQDHHPGGTVGGELLPDGGQGPVQRLVDGVQLGRPVHANRADRAVCLDGQLLWQVVDHGAPAREEAPSGALNGPVKPREPSLRVISSRVADLPSGSRRTGSL